MEYNFSEIHRLGVVSVRLVPMDRIVSGTNLRNTTLYIFRSFYSIDQWVLYFFCRLYKLDYLKGTCNGGDSHASQKGVRLPVLCYQDVIEIVLYIDVRFLSCLPRPLRVFI